MPSPTNGPSPHGPDRPRSAGGGVGAVAKGFGAVDPRIAPYVERLLEPEDAVLAEIRARSLREGLPPIAIGPFDGRHLEVLARMTGARRIVEIGTLGGYSGVCLARALPPGGRLDTFELEPLHARVAAESFRRAGCRRGRAHPRRAGGGAPSRRSSPTARSTSCSSTPTRRAIPPTSRGPSGTCATGGVVIADNVFRRAAFAIEGDDPRAVDGIRRFNESLARSGRFRATMLPLEDGFAVGVRI